MKSTHSIKIKAVFLLTIFALNTVVGFACSMGIDMGFNAPHATKEINKTEHIHRDGNKHLHPTSSHKHQDHQKANTSQKDDCCKGKVVKLQSADKYIQYSKSNIGAPNFFITKGYSAISVHKSIVPDLQKYFACQFHPPPRDILIAIQRFQI